MDTGQLAEQYLALLAEDRPAADFELLRQDAESDPERGPRLHELAERARGLRETGRRRESELRALYDTVADLSALKELDAVLEAIVRRARRLLGCDVSYLSLNDPEAGVTYVRVTQGIVSEEFRNARLVFGDAVGGRVAQTARPFATADYFNDPRFQHTGHIDGLVRTEELTAILGVPLLHGRTVIGVLFAANHAPGPFSRDDVVLLTTFAGHAALALDNARRGEEREAAVAELQETSERLRQILEGSRRTVAAHDRLLSLVVHGGSLQDLAGELGQVLDLPVMLLDPRGAPLASSEPARSLTEEQAGLVARALDELFPVM